jgi:hypothetical protein
MKRFLTVCLLLLVLFALPIFGSVSKPMGSTGSAASNAAPLSPQRRMIWVRRHRRRRRGLRIVLFGGQRRDRDRRDGGRRYRRYRY